MSRENVIRFEQLLQVDEELQMSLKAAIETYDGEKSDERAFIEAVFIPLAEKAGLPYTYEDVVTATKSSEIDDEELDAFTGGWSACIFVGVSDEISAGCGRTEGHACAFVGIGIMDYTR